jgi:hypothetical protein
MTKLKSQDVVILIKMLANSSWVWSVRGLAKSTAISSGEVNKALKRLNLCKLVRQGRGAEPQVVPILAAAKEFLTHGIRYVFPAEPGVYTPGVETGFAAPVLNKHILSDGNDPVPVWPYFKGSTRGVAINPLYETVPQALDDYPDQKFYDLLALVDAIRSGRARERAIATDLLDKRMQYED